MKNFAFVALLGLFLSPAAFAYTKIKIECAPSVGNSSVTVGNLAFDLSFDDCAITSVDGRSTNVKIAWVAFDDIQGAGLLAANSVLNVSCEVRSGKSLDGKYEIIGGGAAAYGVGGMIAFAANDNGSCTAIGASVGVGGEYFSSGVLEIRLPPNAL